MTVTHRTLLRCCFMRNDRACLFEAMIFWFFWLCWVFVAAGLLSSCGAWASHSAGFSCCRAGSRCTGFGRWRSPALSTGLVVAAQGLSCSVAAKGSSQTRDRACFSCLGRWVLYHGATGEPGSGFLCNFTETSLLRDSPPLFFLLFLPLL